MGRGSDLDALLEPREAVGSRSSAAAGSGAASGGGAEAAPDSTPPSPPRFRFNALMVGGRYNGRQVRLADLAEKVWVWREETEPGAPLVGWKQERGPGKAGAVLYARVGELGPETPSYVPA